MIALLDADIIMYRCAASAENDVVDAAIARTNDLINRILYETASDSYIGYLSGSNNFRYDLYPDYKAHRRDKPKPKWLEEVREHLVKHWGCRVTDGIEADDALGIDQDKELYETIICSLDKDLLQIPGRHYNFVSMESRIISPLNGLQNFYCQTITGDAADHIPAFDGKFRNTIPKFVQKLIDPVFEMDKEVDMFNYSKSVYLDDTYERNAKLLYIMKKENDYWTPPTTTDDGVPDECEDLSHPHCGTPPDDGPLNMTH